MKKHLLAPSLLLLFLPLIPSCSTPNPGDPSAPAVPKPPSRWSTTAFSVTLGYGALTATIGIPARTSEPPLPTQPALPASAGDGKTPALFPP